MSGYDTRMVGAGPPDPAVPVHELLAVAADRLARLDDAGAHRTQDLRALGVLHATVDAEDDVLTGQDPDSAHRTGRKLCCDDDRARMEAHREPVWEVELMVDLPRRDRHVAAVARAPVSVTDPALQRIGGREESSGELVRDRGCRR